ncbi:epsilon-sarcoglycan-like, partial [Lingula anatina]|uniref:Epsilon-sarcoglycan-like n=1 Tax=Lingula anatina TaxID=7574 RepID=A0A1S3IV25_LINAN
MMREVYSTLFLVLCIYHVEGESAVLGQHFLHIIKRQEFFSQGNTAAIEFQAKSKSYPDLPSWLTLKQRTELQDAYLFGTPRAGAVSTDIQIIALNKGTYQTEQDAFSITVDTTKDLPKSIVELRVKNYNIEEFLAGQALSNLTRIMAKLWPEAGTLQVVKVSSLVDELGRVPVPDGPMQPLPKEGVLVQIGGAGDFSALLASVSQQVNNTNCMNQEQFIGIREDFEPEFNLDWCAFKMFPL